jgi:hypothetical protein
MIIKLMKIVSFLLLMVAAPSLVISQGGYQSGSQPNGNETPCPNPFNNCCQIDNACNGQYSPIGAAWNYDPDYSATGGCDLSCTPIDSGVLFLLLGGAAFGGFLIMRRRETDLIPTRA